MSEAGYAVGKRLLLIDIQKNRASLNRARSTRSLPWRTKPSGSALVFITAMKCGAELAIGVFHGKVLLVVPHHGDQHFGGEAQVFGIEAAQDRLGCSVM